MTLTESSEDILHSFTDRGVHWAEACLYCTDEALHCAENGDSEGLKVWRDRAFEIDEFCRKRAFRDVP